MSGRQSSPVEGNFRIVMAGLVPAIHVYLREDKGVDARDKPGHDEFVDAPSTTITAHVVRPIGRTQNPATLPCRSY
jgi:hypothetical protein